MPRMERLHPNQTSIDVRAASRDDLCLAGCSNQQMSASNPFMSPDRVPPPATRTIAPGTGRPYYPGDPIPARAEAPPATGAADGRASAAPRTSHRPRCRQFAAGCRYANASSAARRTAAARVLQRADRGDSDGQPDLRFAVPPPPRNRRQPMPPLLQPFAATGSRRSKSCRPLQPAGCVQPTPAAAPMPTARRMRTSGPWRSPQVPNAGSPVMQAQYVQPQPVQPHGDAAAPCSPRNRGAAPATAMPVQLRAVAVVQVADDSANDGRRPQWHRLRLRIDPALTPPPRMRFPSWTDPSTWFTPQPATTRPPPGQQLVGYMVPGPNGKMQMVSVEQYAGDDGRRARRPRRRWPLRTASARAGATTK